MERPTACSRVSAPRRPSGPKFRDLPVEVLAGVAKHLSMREGRQAFTALGGRIVPALKEAWRVSFAKSARTPALPVLVQYLRKHSDEARERLLQATRGLRGSTRRVTRANKTDYDIIQQRLEVMARNAQTNTFRQFMNSQDVRVDVASFRSIVGTERMQIIYSIADIKLHFYKPGERFLASAHPQTIGIEIVHAYHFALRAIKSYVSVGLSIVDLRGGPHAESSTLRTLAQIVKSAAALGLPTQVEPHVTVLGAYGDEEKFLKKCVTAWLQGLVRASNGGRFVKHSIKRRVRNPFYNSFYEILNGNV